MYCNIDDCDQEHCKRCCGHTIGNILIGGMCQECYDYENDQFNEYMQEKYREQLDRQAAGLDELM